MKRKILRFVPLILWMALIFYFSAQTAERSTAMSDPFSSAAGRLYEWIRAIFPNLKEASAEELVFFTRKAAHAFLYFVLAVLSLYGVCGATRKPILRYGIAFLICVLYAFSDEVHQAFLPGRAMRLSDVANDALSSLIALGVCYLIRIIKRRKRTNE